MPQENTKSWIDSQQFFDFAIKYHDKEPIIANIIALSVPAIIIILIIVNYLKHKRDSLVQDKQNIMNYKLKYEKIKSKNKERK